MPKRYLRLYSSQAQYLMLKKISHSISHLHAGVLIVYKCFILTRVTVVDTVKVKFLYHPLGLLDALLARDRKIPRVAVILVP